MENKEKISGEAHSEPLQQYNVMCSTNRTNQRTIKVYNSNDKYLGSETFDERFTKSDINKLLNKKYPWTWEYYT